MGNSKSNPRGNFAVAAFLARLVFAPENRGLVLTAAVVIAAIAAALYGWHRFGAAALAEKEYTVGPEQIQVTPQPAWIHGNVKAEVLRTANAAGMSLLDRKLVERLAQAFALHPWVAEVVRVEKRYPAAVHVDIRYRRPVLVVKLDVPGEDGLLFLDEESTLLPSADFAPSQARDYLRIAAQGETPAGVYGSPWGTPRMAGAARVAAAWQQRWQPLGLFWLVASRPASGELLYELRTQDDKVRILWGAASGESNEPSAAEKIAALERYVQDKGPLTSAREPQTIDLRELGGR